MRTLSGMGGGGEGREEVYKKSTFSLYARENDEKMDDS